VQQGQDPVAELRTGWGRRRDTGGDEVSESDSGLFVEVVKTSIHTHTILSVFKLCQLDQHIARTAHVGHLAVRVFRGSWFGLGLLLRQKLFDCDQILISQRSFWMLESLRLS
jgi:hypothetical protein